MVGCSAWAASGLNVIQGRAQWAGGQTLIVALTSIRARESLAAAGSADPFLESEKKVKGIW